MASGLNPAQHEAVHVPSGPLLVLAGAGTGKTRVVTYRIAELIRRGTSPDRILAVTFTNKAATEMQQRVFELLGRRQKLQPEISTFHSLCVRVLRRHIRQLGYPPQFAIYDRGDQEGLARSALRQIKVPGESLRPGDLIALISRWKSAAIDPAQAVLVAETDKEHLAASAYRRYQHDLKASGAVDFDDLLLLTETLYRRFPAIRHEDAQRYDHLLVDEYQDTNTTQYKIIQYLAMGHRNLCVVGDDDQAIYGWRGAEVTHILGFRKDWRDAKVIRLEENYRSTAAILEMANRLIRFNAQRHGKVLRAARHGGARPGIWQLPDEEQEAQRVVEDIQLQLQQPGVQPRDLAILFRTNEQPRAYEMALRQAKVPYVLIGGMSFYDRKEVRDLLAYFKLIAHPHDEVSLRRVINKPPRGIGNATVALLIERAVAESRPLWDVLPTAPENAEISEKVAGAIDRFRALIESFAQRARNGRLAALANALIDAIEYRRELKRLFPSEEDFASRWASVEEIVNALAAYEKRASGRATLAGFLERIALAERDSEGDKESQLARNAVALMTLHAAKGLEFSQVYLVGMEEGILPHRRSIAGSDGAIDEERRLCYVGVTRAQDRLTMTLSLTRLKWGKQQESIPSRFLYELTGREPPPRSPPPPGRNRRAASRR